MASMRRNPFNPIWMARRIAYKLYERRHPDEPWLSQDAVGHLRKALSTDWVGLEWGSGRSTQWFAPRLRHLTSVENNAEWFAEVRRQTATLANVDLILADDLEQFVAAADRGPFDFILVDGHWRRECARAAVGALNPSGLLVIDNTDWLGHQNWDVPPDWPVVHRSSNVMTETTIWRRPSR